MSSDLALKTVWILISWLLQKPADLDLHCLQEKPADQEPYYLQELINIWFHTVFEKNKLFKHCKVLANLFFRTSNIFYGQVHFGLLLVSGQVENFTVSTPEYCINFNDTSKFLMKDSSVYMYFLRPAEVMLLA